MQSDSLNPNHRVLVIGAGSIGERHIGILQKLGLNDIHVLRRRMLPLRSIAENSINVITEWSQVAKLKPYAAIICSPTSQHWEQLKQCLSLGMHVLVEKPISSEFFDLNEVFSKLSLQNPVHIQIAFMLRYHPVMQDMKTRIESRQYGALLHINSYWGEYLPNWHPWEDYRQSYAARKALGGGVALTLSHDIDLMCWLVGERVKSQQRGLQHFSPLEVDVESSADVVLGFENGVYTNSHLNFFEQVPRRFYRFVFEEASLEFDYYTSELRIQSDGQSEVIGFHDFERDDMFEAQTIDFFKNCQKPDLALSKGNVQNALTITQICI